MCRIKNILKEAPLNASQETGSLGEQGKTDEKSGRKQNENGIPGARGDRLYSEE